MSDFLGKLAARSLGRAKTLQPRVPSRFEPSGPAPLPSPEVEPFDFEAGPSPERETVSLVRPFASPVLVAPAPQPASATPDPMFLGHRKAQAAVPPRTTALWAEPVSSPPAAASPSSPIVRPQQPQPAVEPAPIWSRRRTAQRVELAEPELSADLAPAPAPAPHVPPLQPAASLAEPSEPPPAMAAARPHDPAEQRHPQQRQEHPPSAVRLEPKVIPARLAPLAPALRTAAREPRPAESPAPTIQVTIGRIEVRATPAPKVSPRDRPAARATVDLEEYLRQRSKGEGR